MGPAFPHSRRMSIKQPSFITPLSVCAMSTSLQVLLWTCCITTLGLSEEVADGVPILKEINRVNDDGSYTFGYEAADGSFKIETRDVQGNVKGMFGYIDDAGELKRVSYTANNGTGYQSVTTTAKPKEKEETSTKRPVFILRQPTSSRAPVIQHIPRKNPDISLSTTTAGYGEYINGRKPVMEIILNSATSNLEENREQTNDVRPSPTPPSLRRILVTRRPIVEESTTIRQGKGGNALRRQLNNDHLSRPADAPDIYPDEGHSRLPTQGTRFQNPLLSSLLPHATPAYRNHLLSQNSGRIPPYLLRPEYPNIDPTYQPPFDPNENPEITTTIAPAPQSFPTQHRLYPEAPLPHVPVARKFGPNVPLDEQQYPVTNGQDPRRYRPVPSVHQISPVLQQRPMYPSDNDYSQGPQISAVQSLRDELMEYLLQYLQQRNGRTSPGFGNRLPVPPQYYNPGYNPYNQYPNHNQNQYFPNPQVPFNPYPNQYGPYSNQNPFYNPYMNQNFPFQNPNQIYPNAVPQQFVPPIGVPPGLSPGNPYSNVPYNNPNIQYSPQQQVSQQSVPSQSYSPHLTEARIGTPIYRNARPTNSVSENDVAQQELFRMLVAASTRVTPTQSYSPTTELPKRSTQPVRNVQILGAASETVTQRVLSNSSLGSTAEPVTQKSTTPTPAEDEMEQVS